MTYNTTTIYCEEELEVEVREFAKDRDKSLSEFTRDLWKQALAEARDGERGERDE